MVELLSVNAAKLLDLGVGSFKKGKPADLVILDPNKTVNLSSNFIKSKSKNYPFENLKAKGKVMLTMVDGKIIYNDRKFIL